MDKRLPKNVVFKGDNEKYMAAVQPPETDHVYLQFYADKFDKRCIHIIEYPDDSDGTIIRIKSHFYDKYWRRSPKWIWADSSDTSTSNRDTLFQLVKIGEDTYALKNLGNGLYCKRLTDDMQSCLSASAESMVREAHLKVEEAGNMEKRLPKNVVFKGDNGMYLAAFYTDNFYLQFYPEDALEARCRHIIEYTDDSDGTFRIKSHFYDKYWRRSPKWIWADSSDTSTNNRDTLFQLVKIGEDMYALKNLGNGLYCKRLTDDKQSCLSASAESLVRETHLKVEEAVVSRKISNIDYRISEAKIHDDKKPLTLTSRQAANNSNTADKMTLGLKYIITKERKWDSSYSMKFGVKTTIEAGIPEIIRENIEISSEYSSEYNWGETKTITEENTTDYEVTVPPNSEATVRVVATEATCDIPFSYTQEDVLTTGEKVITPFHDGIYRGVNSFDVKIEHSLKKL